MTTFDKKSLSYTKFHKRRKYWKGRYILAHFLGILHLASKSQNISIGNFKTSWSSCFSFFFKLNPFLTSNLIKRAWAIEEGLDFWWHLNFKKPWWNSAQNGNIQLFCYINCVFSEDICNNFRSPMEKGRIELSISFHVNIINVALKKFLGGYVDKRR